MSADAGRLQRHVATLASTVRSERHDPAGMSSAWTCVTTHLADAGWTVIEHPLRFRCKLGVADDKKPGGWWAYKVHRGLRGCYVLATPPAAVGSPLILAAHLDTVMGSPGADDNASIVAVLLELATLLDSSTTRPVMLAFLDMEETGHFGAQALTRQMAASGAAGMACLEMVGYYSDEPGSQKLPPAAVRLIEGDERMLNNVTGELRGDFLLVIHRRSSGGLAAGVRDGAAGSILLIATLQDPRPERWGRRLATLLRPVTSNLDRSDHVSFWDRGIPSIAVADTANLRNPHYHRPSDTADTLDYDRLAALTDAIAHLVEHLPASAANADVSTPAGRGER